jgi:hypothetical protein
LFTALALGSSALVNGQNKEYHALVHTFLLILILAGTISPLLILFSLDAAIKQLRAATYWWRENGSKPDAVWEQLDVKRKFPPIKGPARGELSYEDMGIESDKLNEWPKIGPYYIPHFLTFIWICALGMVLYSWNMSARAPATAGYKVTIEQAQPIKQIQVNP